MKIAVIMNHSLNEEQIRDLKKNFGIEDILYPPESIKAKWAQIPPELSTKELEEYLFDVKEWLYKTNANNAIIVGEPVASLLMQNYFLSLGGTLYFATTKREAIEKEVDGKVVKTSVFKHIGFRIVTKGLLEGGKND